MLDSFSYVVFIILLGIMSAAVLGSLFSTGYVGVRTWFWANLLACAALLTLAFRAVFPSRAADGLAAIATNVGLVLAAFLVLRGCRDFFFLRPNLKPGEYAACVALLLWVCYWYFVSPSHGARVAASSLCHVYVFGCLAWIAHTSRPNGRPCYVYWFLTLASTLVALGYLARMVFFLWAGNDLALLHSGLVNAIFLGLAILTMPYMAIGLVMLVHDRLAQSLERQANYDDLTGILARRAYIERAEAMLGAAAAGGWSVSAMVVDIDHFKAVNDNYGHTAGDLVLAHFADVISRNLRTRDVFGRLGGEEFAVICPETGLEEAVGLANRLREKIAEAPCFVDGQPVHLTVSIGVAEWVPGEALSNFGNRSDAAMYAAKQAGRDQVRVAPPPVACPH